MSQVKRETIECPNCHRKGEFELWDSVNVDLDPELREKIFNEELFLYHCPHCGHVTGIPMDTFYHDMKNQFMLFFSFFKEDDFDYKPMDMDVPKSMMKGDYTFRMVFGLMQLKEKIVILEHGLNDVAVERQKYMISHVIMPEIAQKGYELYFAKVDEPSEEFEYGAIYYFYEDKETEEIMTVRFAMDNYYEHCLACEIDPRMKVEGCVCVDQDWMNLKFQEDK